LSFIRDRILLPAAELRAPHGRYARPLVDPGKHRATHTDSRSAEKIDRTVSPILVAPLRGARDFEFFSVSEGRRPCSRRARGPTSPDLDLRRAVGYGSASSWSSWVSRSPCGTGLLDRLRRSGGASRPQPCGDGVLPADASVAGRVLGRSAAGARGYHAHRAVALARAQRALTGTPGARASLTRRRERAGVPLRARARTSPAQSDHAHAPF